MAYGRRKKSKKIRGKSLIKKMTEASTPPPPPIIDETPTPPTQSNEATDYGAASGPPPMADTSNVTQTVDKKKLPIAEGPLQFYAKVDSPLGNRNFSVKLLEHENQDLSQFSKSDNIFFISFSY